MGLFSKEQCCFCGNSVGFFKRKKLINNQGYVCSECEKKISSNLPFEKVDKAFLEKTMAYFEKQGKLYNEAFAPIDKKQKHRTVMEAEISFHHRHERINYRNGIQNSCYQSGVNFDQGWCL